MTRLTSWGPFAQKSVAPEEAPTDGELLARWGDHADRHALELLIRRHGGAVLATCRRILGNTPDADDAFQAVFLVFFRKAASLDKPERVAGWLRGVAVRVARKALRQRQRRHERESSTMIEPIAPDPAEDNEELGSVLAEELDRLPDKYRLPIQLCEVEGLTLDEAARRLGWPKGTVAGRLSRGRERLRKRLDRRRLMALPPLAGLQVPDALVETTVEAVAAGAAAARPAALAEAVLREWGRWRVGLVLLLLLTVAGVAAAASWAAQPSHHAQQPSSAEPSPAQGSCH